MRRDIETLWSVEDVADYLAMPVKSVYEMTTERSIPHLRIGGHVRFRRADIDRWLDSLAVPCLDSTSALISHQAANPPLEAPPATRRVAPQLPLSSSQPSPPPPSKPIRRPPTLAAPSRRDGAEYRYLQEFVKRMAESHGFQVIEPQSLDGQGSVDLALDREGWRLAFQILVTSSIEQEIGNVRERLDSGFDAVAVVSSNKRQAGKLRRVLAKSLPRNEAARVRLLAPEELPEYFEELETRMEPVRTVGGYRVKVRYVQIDPAEQERRLRELAKVLAQSIRRMKKLDTL